MALTKEQRLAMKHADTVSFHCFENENKHQLSVIKLSKDVKVGGFTSKAEVEIPVQALFTFYENIEEETNYNHFAHFMLHAPALNGSWGAFLNLVKTGDEIILSVVAGKNSPTITNVGLFCDELQVTISRSGEAVVREMLLDYSVCPPNSARAVQTLGRKPEIALTASNVVTDYHEVMASDGSLPLELATAVMDFNG